METLEGFPPAGEVRQGDLAMSTLRCVCIHTSVLHLALLHKYVSFPVPSLRSLLAADYLFQDPGFRIGLAADNFGSEPEPEMTEVYKEIVYTQQRNSWVNLNSFVARLHEARLGAWNDLAVSQLRCALEDPLATNPPFVIATKAKVASEWILPSRSIPLWIVRARGSPRG